MTIIHFFLHKNRSHVSRAQKIQRKDEENEREKQRIVFCTFPVAFSFFLFLFFYLAFFPASSSVSRPAFFCCLVYSPRLSIVPSLPVSFSISVLLVSPFLRLYSSLFLSFSFYFFTPVSLFADAHLYLLVSLLSFSTPQRTSCHWRLTSASDRDR